MAGTGRRASERCRPSCPARSEQEDSHSGDLPGPGGFDCAAKPHSVGIASSNSTRLEPDHAIDRLDFPRIRVQLIHQATDRAFVRKGDGQTAELAGSNFGDSGRKVSRSDGVKPIVRGDLKLGEQPREKLRRQRVLDWVSNHRIVGRFRHWDFLPHCPFAESADQLKKSRKRNVCPLRVFDLGLSFRNQSGDRKAHRDPMIAL